MIIEWSNKDNAENVQQAIEAIADFLSSSIGIRSAQKDDLDEVESFAKKWNVSFDRNLISKMVSFQSDKRWGGDGARVSEKTDEEWMEIMKNDSDWYGHEEIQAEIKHCENPDDIEAELHDWLHDYRNDKEDESHIWQSSSERC